MSQVIRLTPDRKLTEDEVEIFYDIVDEITEGVYVSAHDDDGEVIDDEVAVMEFKEEDQYLYEIVVTMETTRHELGQIAEDLNNETDFDFELEMTDE